MIWRNSRLAGRIPELDGIRGLAILLVLIWHYFMLGFRTSLGSWQAYALVPLRLTWTGVDLFFVLSGFLIGGILYDARNCDRYYSTFYLRRIYRIFPIYFIWIALFGVGLSLVGPRAPAPLRDLFNRDLPLWGWPLFLQNFFMSSYQMFGASWLRVTWSLAVEEQFYFLLPFVVRKLAWRGVIWLCAAAILVAPLFRLTLWLSGNEYMGPYTLLPARADALGFGVIIALLCRNQSAYTWLVNHRRHFSWAFIVLGLGLVVMTVRQRYLYVGGLTWIAAFYASMLVLAVVNPGRVEMAFFRNRLLTRLGTMAYAVYILHEGVNALFHYAIFRRLPGITDLSSFSVTLLSLMTVITLAALSWRLFEKPLIQRAHAAHRYEPVPHYPAAPPQVSQPSLVL
jgi:peptidoglycan/LPS O-acetylase OafA/YrhL